MGRKKKRISKIIFACLVHFLGTNDVPLKTIGEILCRGEIRVTVNMITWKCGFLDCRNSCKPMSDDDDGDDDDNDNDDDDTLHLTLHRTSK